MVSCVDKDSPFKPHPHRLVGDSCKQGVCTVLNRSGDTVTFKSIGIQRAKRSNVKDYINERKNIRVDPYRSKYHHVNQTAQTLSLGSSHIV